MPKDLVVLAADTSTEHGIRGLLGRPTSLGIRPILAATDLFVHPQRDPGCFRRAEEFHRPFVSSHHHALVVFDRIGCGQEQRSPAEISERVCSRLVASGWEGRAQAIILDPELEVWVFSASRQVERCLGWPTKGPRLRPWLEERGMWAPGRAKPADPKAALERALRHIQKPKSSATFRRLAERVDVQGCADPAFIAFRDTLQAWFPERGPQ